ncbi:MAG: DNA polymerase III subunit delta, partial [Fidelibacterota bacterium]
MGIITIKQLSRRILSGNVSPVYLIMGDDSYIQDYSVDLIKSGFQKNEGTVIRLTIGDDSETILMDELCSISLFENRRLILVRQITRLSSKCKSEFLEYLTEPSSDICLILLCDNFYDRSKFIEKLKNDTLVLDARSPINDNNFKSMMIDICKTKKININADALDLIIHKQGNSLAQAFSEIMNLWLMIEETGNIDRELVETTVGYGREYPLWKYLHALGQKNLPLSLEMIDSLIDVGISVPQVAISLNTLFENVYWTKFRKSYNSGYTGLN